MSLDNRSTMLFVEDEQQTGKLYLELLGSRFPNLNIIWETEGQKAIEVINELHEQILIVLTDGNLADQITGTEVIEVGREKKIYLILFCILQVLIN
jgi:CheY-like chemotaxis protein